MALIGEFGRFVWLFLIVVESNQSATFGYSFLIIVKTTKVFIFGDSYIAVANSDFAMLLDIVFVLVFDLVGFME